jgi:aspartate kinase
MALIVQKYGGTSLATPKHIRQAASRIKGLKQAGDDLVVVASAMGRMTDHLVSLARRTVNEPPQRELDMLLTAGERISMSLLAMALQDEGVPAISFTGSQCGIVTTADHTEARILAIRGHRIREELAKGKVVIVAGFQGVSEAKEITTLGRGGSDTTAVALAASLGAARCEILTDVDGLFSADPRIVTSAKLLPHCSYDEALELASLGAKMHPRSLEVAKRFRVPVRIAAAHRYESDGTRVGAENSGKENPVEAIEIRGVTTQDGFQYFKSTLPLNTILELLRGRKIRTRFFAHGGGQSLFLCEEEKAKAVEEILRAKQDKFEKSENIAVISVVGDGVSSSADLLPDFLKAVESTGTEPLLVSANSLSASVAIASPVKEAVARAVHLALIESRSPV